MGPLGMPNSPVHTGLLANDLQAYATPPLNRELDIRDPNVSLPRTPEPPMGKFLSFLNGVGAGVPLAFTRAMDHSTDAGQARSVLDLLGVDTKHPLQEFIETKGRSANQAGMLASSFIGGGLPTYISRRSLAGGVKALARGAEPTAKQAKAMRRFRDWKNQDFRPTDISGVGIGAAVPTAHHALSGTLTTPEAAQDIARGSVAGLGGLLAVRGMTPASLAREFNVPSGR